MSITALSGDQFESQLGYTGSPGGGGGGMGPMGGAAAPAAPAPVASAPAATGMPSMGANLSAAGGSANPITNITSMAKDIFGGGGWSGKVDPAMVQA